MRPIPGGALALTTSLFTFSAALAQGPEGQPAAAPAAPAAPAAAQDAGPKTKVLVLPFQAIYRSVTQQKLDAATQLFFKELEQKEKLAITRGAVGGAEANKGPSLEAPRAALAAAEKAEQERRIADAIAEWKKTIAAYEANAAALESIDEYLMAHHRLARALMMSGNDKEAKSVLDQVARMAPGVAVPAGQFSRLYRKWFADAAAAAVKEQPGSIMVGSALPGAKVSIDGRDMEVAPVLLERVVPGKHLIVARVPDVPGFSAVVNVAPRQKAEVRATFSGTLGGSAVGQVTDAIAQNSIPKPAVDAAAQAGKDAGADFVILGALSKDDDKFRVHTYLVQSKSAKIAELEEVTFDLELLTAETDVLRIANSANDTISKFPAGGTQVAQIEKRIKAQSNITKVDASPEYADASGRPTGNTKAKGPRQVLKPLGGGTIDIKDEQQPKD